MEEGRQRARDVKKLISDAAKHKPLIEALAPIREAYQRCTGQQRQQLLAAIVQHVVQP